MEYRRDLRRQGSTGDGMHQELQTQNKLRSSHKAPPYSQLIVHGALLITIVKGLRSRCRKHKNEVYTAFADAATFRDSLLS